MNQIKKKKKKKKQEKEKDKEVEIKKIRKKYSNKNEVCELKNTVLSIGKMTFQDLAQFQDQPQQITKKRQENLSLV